MLDQDRPPLPRPGNPYPLGATWDGEGTNFALFSEHGAGVELCLFDHAGAETRVVLPGRTGSVWHGYLPAVGPSQRYGYRVHGPWAPQEGHRFNAAKLLIDPYARAIDGDVSWTAARAFPHAPGGVDADLVADPEDDASAIPKCVVVDPGFEWEDDRPPRTPWEETVVYELHVKGFTRLHPGVREDLRGTYAGLASEAAIEELRSLGVTAVELLPIHHFAGESFLQDRGLTNYWGYSSIGFLAPHAAYAATGTGGEQVRELKGMVKALHRAGIEVILDVVYNHTVEGSHLGPVLSFKGIDNASYYRLAPDRRHYLDFTGTGNTLDATHPAVIRLITDSLRAWVLEYHVDGFRFDLAAALAREQHGFDPGAGLLDAIGQDPVLSRVKLIAEPWDIGPGGYQVGGFPAPWAEWNGRYRDAVRDFWRGHGHVAEFARRFAGSSDLFVRGGRGPLASVNFVTAHDGFTLADLVSYDGKHNEANLEVNHDGTDDNRSWNCGVEGPASNPKVRALRARQQRNFLATLLLSQGVPMLVAGDERGRTQGGNNNAWCQDNEVSWLDWDGDGQLVEAVRRLLELRREHPAFRRRTFLAGRGSDRSHLPDVWWFRPDGRRMTRNDWHRDDLRSLGVFLNGEEIPERTPEGEPVRDNSFLVVFNAHHEPVAFRLPVRRFGARWHVELATGESPAGTFIARAELTVAPRSLVLLRRV